MTTINEQQTPPIEPGAPQPAFPAGAGGLFAFERRHQIISKYSGPILLVLLLLFFTMTQENFRTSANFVGVLSTQAIAGVVALALLVPLASGIIDVSISGSMTVAVVLSAWLFKTTDGSIPTWLVCVIAVCAGVLIGLFNALLIVVLEVDSFIATIATTTVLLGISEFIANGATISEGIPDSFTAISQTTIGQVPLTVVYLAVFALLFWYVLEYTPLGRRIYATGLGPGAARLAGVRTGHILTFSLVISAVFASIAGVLYASRVGAGLPNVGAGYLLSSFGAAFLGATMIKPGRFNVPGLFGMFIIAFGVNGLQLRGVSFWVVDVFQGGALIVAVVIAQLRTRRA
jgi:ribose transport system permease protein